MSPSNEHLLRDQLVGSARDAFAAYDVRVTGERLAFVVDDDPRLASVIGFSGEGMTGELAVVAPRSLMRSSYPVPGRRDSASEAEVDDWAGEFANQVLGRLRSRLLMKGLDIQPSTPHTMPADALPRRRGSALDACSLRCYASSEQHDLVELWLDFAPASVDLSGDGEGTEALAPGEVVWF